jgi:Skp family chaperone for outer membrane proteins
MTRLATILASTGIALAAANVALPAQAQVQGNIASADVPGAVIGTAAFQNAYKQVETSYAQQIDLIRTRAQERQTLLAKFDKNGDKQVDETEQDAMRKSPDAPKLASLEQEIQQLSNQIDSGRVYAIEQILLQAGPALEEVVKAKQIKIVLEPGAMLYAPPEIDITKDIVTALNTKVPAVQVVPPAGWQPSQEGVQIFQQITQRLQLAQLIQQRQAQAAQQQGNTAAPAGR